MNKTMSISTLLGGKGLMALCTAVRLLDSSVNNQMFVELVQPNKSLLADVTLEAKFSGMCTDVL